MHNIAQRHSLASRQNAYEDHLNAKTTENMFHGHIDRKERAKRQFFARYFKMNINASLGIGEYQSVVVDVRLQ